MKLTDEERKPVVAHRIQRAKETLLDAKIMAESERWHGTINRLYYACYYIASALLIKHGHLTRTHSGVIRLLNEHFVQKGIVSDEQGRFYGRLFALRQTGNYNDWVDVKPENVKLTVAPAEEFITTIEKLILLP